MSSSLREDLRYLSSAEVLFANPPAVPDAPVIIAASASSLLPSHSGYETGEVWFV
jgi:hypothetical protein